MKKKGIAVILAMLVMACCFLTFGTIQTQAKTYRYCGSLLPLKNVIMYYPSMHKQIGYIYKAKLTRKKITLYGYFVRYDGTRGQKGKKYISGKKTFKLAKNVICEGVEEDRYPKFTIAQTRSLLANLNGLYFSVYVKNGKVTRLRFAS